MSLNLFLSQFLGVGLSFIEVLLKLLAIVVPLLISVAYFTLAERKLMAGMHRRRGPNVVGFFGGVDDDVMDYDAYDDDYDDERCC